MLRALALLALLTGSSAAAGGGELRWPNLEWEMFWHRFETRRPKAAPRPTRYSGMDVNACWTRDPHPEADALGLAARVCLRRVGVAVAEPAAGSLHVSGGARRAGGWDIVGSMLQVSRPSTPCGKPDTAFVTVDVAIDDDGIIQPREPKLRAHLYSGRRACPHPGPSEYFPYRREP